MTTARLCPYNKAIKKVLDDLHLGTFNPNQVEGYMRLQYSTLDHLSREEFRRQVEIAVECIQLVGEEAAEKNARSFGL